VVKNEICRPYKKNYLRVYYIWISGPLGLNSNYLKDAEISRRISDNTMSTKEALRHSSRVFFLFWLKKKGALETWYCLKFFERFLHLSNN
jgi:hypothetical protein